MKNTHFEHTNLSKHLDESFSEARGGRGGGGHRGGGGFRGGRGGGFARRGGFSRGGFARRGGGGRSFRHGGYYGGLYGWGWGYYPFSILPVYDYYYDVVNPKRISITPKGLKYLSLNPKTNIYTYYLNAIKDGSVYNEPALYSTLNLGDDYNTVVGWLYGNKLINFAN